jgi:hypothetical protein
VQRLAFAALDDQTSDAAWLEQRLEDLEIFQIDKDLLAVLR